MVEVITYKTILIYLSLMIVWNLNDYGNLPKYYSKSINELK